MNQKTKKKLLEENVFADIIVLVGTYMEYVKLHSTYDKEHFLEYYNSKKDNFVSRCWVQRSVIRQAKSFYEEHNEIINITYSKVKRMFRKDLNSSYKIRMEQYFFWKYVMDYILVQKELMDIMFHEVISRCGYYTPTEDVRAPFISCMQELLGYYYVRMKMNKKIFSFNDIRRTMLDMFLEYENYPEFKKVCRIYHSQL